MKWKKMTAVFLAVSMTAGIMSGCGNSSQTMENEAEASKAVQETGAAQKDGDESKSFNPRTITEGVKVTIAVPADAMVEDYNTNEMTFAIEEALGVDLEFSAYAAADYETKLNVMAMSGEKLPDIMFNPGSTSYLEWADEGAIISLNEFYENKDLSSNFWAASEAFDMDLYGMMKDAEGEVYYLPASHQNYEDMVSSKLWIYEPWLNAIGADVPETVEEFYEICKQISQKDLNGNGKQDEIPMTGFGFTTGGNDGWFKELMSAYIYAWGLNYLVADQGELSFAYTSEEWKEGIKFIKKFFDEGLIPLETLTQDGAQYEAVWKSEEEVKLFSFVFYHMGGTNLERKTEYCYVPALTRTGGEKNVAEYRPTVPAPGAVISADCENPEAAFLVCDYMLREDMSITNRFGKCGKDWDYWNDAKVNDKADYAPSYEGYDISFIAYDDIGFFSSQKPQNVSYVQKGPFLLSADVLNGSAKKVSMNTQEEKWVAEATKRRNEAALDCMKRIPDEVVSRLVLTPEENEVASDIQTSLDTYFYESTCDFLVGEKDIDQEWDNYISELEKIGYRELLQIYQEAYNRSNQK